MNTQRGSESFADLYNVTCNYKFWRFGVALFRRWARGSQPEDPLHLVLQALLALLFIHIQTWRCDILSRLTLIASGGKDHIFHQHASGLARITTAEPWQRARALFYRYCDGDMKQDFGRNGNFCISFSLREFSVREGSLWHLAGGELLQSLLI